MSQDATSQDAASRGGPRGAETVAVCAACGGAALTARQFVLAAGKLGFSVNPVSGIASYKAIPPVVSPMQGMPQTES